VIAGVGEGQGKEKMMERLMVGLIKIDHIHIHGADGYAYRKEL
jgi:hypothetical protein